MPVARTTKSDRSAATKSKAGRVGPGRQGPVTLIKGLGSADAPRTEPERIVRREPRKPKGGVKKAAKRGK
jgi:hypothetical protein